MTPTWPPTPRNRSRRARSRSRRRSPPQLAAIRERGYAEDLEEYRDGVACVSAPLLWDGVIVAAYTVSTPAHGYEDRREALVAAVLAAAQPERRLA